MHVVQRVADLIAHCARDKIPPGSASISSRAATLTPSPKMSCRQRHIAEVDADAELDPPGGDTRCCAVPSGAELGSAQNGFRDTWNSTACRRRWS